VSLSGRYAYRNGLLTPVAGYGRGVVEAPAAPALFSYTLDVSGDALGDWGLGTKYERVMGGTSQALTVIDDGGTKRLQYSQNRTSRDGVRLLGLPSNVAHFIMRASFKISAVSSDAFIMFGRGAMEGNDDNDLRSVQAMLQASNGRRVSSYSATGTTSVDQSANSTSIAYTADDLLHVELRVLGTAAGIKLWKNADSPPGSYSPSITLSGAGPASGGFGFGANGSGAKSFILHSFTIQELEPPA
jgi:hypothetical protein